MEKNQEDKLIAFFSTGKSNRSKRGVYLINAGDQPSGVFYLKTGYVKMNTIFNNGAELTLNIFKPGSFFPMMWALGDVKNNYYYQAMSNVTAFQQPKPAVLRFIRENPPILLDLTQRLLKGVDGLLTNVQQLLYGNSSNRVASAILLCAVRFGRRFKNDHLILDLVLTHQDIANLAGITRETASLAIENLVKQKVISYSHRHIVVTSPKALAAITSAG